MSGIIVDFTLETTIADTTFYVSNDKTDCLEHKDVPTTFSESDPAECSANAKRGGNRCSQVPSKIHVYIWSDEEEKDQLVEFRLVNDVDHDYWIVDVKSIVQGYNLNYDNPSQNQYILTLENNQ